MAAPPPVLTVAVEKGPRQGETRQCRAGAALRVGRVVKGNDLAVRDGGASQQHLLIEFLPPPGAGWAVSDLGSSNGTLLNGAPLVPSVPAPLFHGDIIKVGDSTVLDVSMASDSDPNPVAHPSQRRTSRHAAAVVEEKPPVVTRRGTRNKAPKAAEAPEVEKVEPDAAAVVVVEEEKPPAVTRRATRNKVPTGSEAPKVEKEEPDAAAVVVEEKLHVARRRGGRKKLAPGEMDETAEAPRQGEQKDSEPSEPENDDGEKAPLVTRRGGRKKNVATVAPPPLPPKTRSVRARGTRATASTIVLQEEQRGNELIASRTQTADQRSPMAVKGGQDQRGVKVAAGDGGVELQDAAKALKEEMLKGKSSAHCAASDNGANAAAGDPTGEKEEEAAEAMPRRRPKKVVECHEFQKDEEETTVVTRRGGRKKVAEQSEPEKDEETTMVARRRGRKKAMEQPETMKGLEETVTHRGGQKKVMEQPESDKEDDEEEGAPVLTRRGRQKEVAEQSEPRKHEVTTVATRRGQRKNVAEQPETKKDLEEATVVTRRGGRKKAMDQLEPEKNMEATIVVTRRGWQKKVEEQPQPDKEDGETEVVALALTRRGGRKKAVKPPELEKEEEDVVGVTRRKGQKKAALVTCHARRKKDPAVVAPPPPKTGPGRGQRRVTRTSAKNNVLEEGAKAEEEEDEVIVSREQSGNLQIEMTMNGGEDKEVEVAVRSLDDDAPEGRDSAQHASSGNGGKENQGGAHCSSRVDSGSNGIPNTTSKYREDTKLKAYSTPFDVRLDRALKKYST